MQHHVWAQHKFCWNIGTTVHHRLLVCMPFSDVWYTILYIILIHCVLIFCIALQCPAGSNMVYKHLTSACIPSCLNPTADKACGLPNTESCTCDTGLLLWKGKCVKPEECGCYHSGKYYKVGKATQLFNYFVELLQWICMRLSLILG